MTSRPCRPWLTYRGNPRQYQPWCECGTWRSPTWTPVVSIAQRAIEQHLDAVKFINAARHSHRARELTRV